MVMIRVYQYAGACLATYFAITSYVNHKEFMTEWRHAREEQFNHAKELKKAKLEMQRALKANGIVSEEEKKNEDLWKVRMGTIH